MYITEKAKDINKNRHMATSKDGDNTAVIKIS